MSNKFNSQTTVYLKPDLSNINIVGERNLIEIVNGTYIDPTTGLIYSYLLPSSMAGVLYQVATVSAMNALTGMQEGNLCIVASPASVYCYSGSAWVQLPEGDTTLASLSDVAISGPTNLQVLQYNSGTSKWTNAPQYLHNDGDVNIVTPSNNQCLVYNSGVSEWENETVSLSSGIISDVAISGPTNGQYLTYNAGSWGNSTFITPTLENLSDVNVSGKVNGQALIWESPSWVNQNIPVFEPINPVTINNPNTGGAQWPFSCYDTRYFYTANAGHFCRYDTYEPWANGGSAWTNIVMTAVTNWPPSGGTITGLAYYNGFVYIVANTTYLWAIQTSTSFVAGNVSQVMPMSSGSTQSYTGADIQIYSNTVYISTNYDTTTSSISSAVIQWPISGSPVYYTLASINSAYTGIISTYVINGLIYFLCGTSTCYVVCYNSALGAFNSSSSYTAFNLTSLNASLVNITNMLYVQNLNQIWFLSNVNAYLIQYNIGDLTTSGNYTFQLLSTTLTGYSYTQSCFYDGSSVYLFSYLDTLYRIDPKQLLTLASNWYSTTLLHIAMPTYHMTTDMTYLYGSYTGSNNSFRLLASNTTIESINTAFSAFTQNLTQPGFVWTYPAGILNSAAVSTAYQVPMFLGASVNAVNLTLASGYIVDVAVSSPTVNQILMYTGSDWANVNLLTTAGQLLYYHVTGMDMLNIGTSGQVLTVSGGYPSWQTPSGGSASFNTLTDVIITNPTINQIPTYLPTILMTAGPNLYQINSYLNGTNTNITSGNTISFVSNFWTYGGTNYVLGQPGGSGNSLNLYSCNSTYTIFTLVTTGPNTACPNPTHAFVDGNLPGNNNIYVNSAGTVYFAIGANTTSPSGYPAIFSASPYTTWTVTGPSGAGYVLNEVIGNVAGSTILICGADGGVTTHYAYSTNSGSTWTTQAMPGPNAAYNWFYNTQFSLFVSCNYGLYTSSDGHTWTNNTQFSGQNVLGVSYNPVTGSMAIILGTTLYYTSGTPASTSWSSYTWSNASQISFGYCFYINGYMVCPTYPNISALFYSGDNIHFSVLSLGSYSATSYAPLNFIQNGYDWVNTPMLNTAGDLLTYSSSNKYSRIPIGTNGQSLQVSGGLPVWATPGAGPANALTTSGANVVINTNSPTTSGEVLVSTSSTNATWQTIGPASGIYFDNTNQNLFINSTNTVSFGAHTNSISIGNFNNTSITMGSGSTICGTTYGNIGNFCACFGYQFNSAFSDYATFIGTDNTSNVANTMGMGNNIVNPGTYSITLSSAGTTSTPANSFVINTASTAFNPSSTGSPSFFANCVRNVAATSNNNVMTYNSSTHELSYTQGLATANAPYGDGYTTPLTLSSNPYTLASVASFSSGSWTNIVSSSLSFGGLYAVSCLISMSTQATSLVNATIYAQLVVSGTPISPVVVWSDSGSAMPSSGTLYTQLIQCYYSNSSAPTITLQMQSVASSGSVVINGNNLNGGAGGGTYISYQLMGFK